MTGRCLGKPERILIRAFQVAAGATCSSDELEDVRRVVAVLSGYLIVVRRLRGARTIILSMEDVRTGTGVCEIAILPIGAGLLA